MSAIFISHAVADQPLASLLTDFLKEAIGVPSEEIFCSSVPGHGVPLTQDFNAYMKDKIQKPSLVFLLMTPSYLESSFCLMELGAAWAKSHRTLPIVVPPVPFDKVTNTLGLVQAWNITNNGGLVDLREAVMETDIKLEKRSEHDWDKKRAEWRQNSKKTIAKLKEADSVPSSEYKSVLAKRDALNLEVEDLERQLDAAADTIERLKEAKDPTEVKDIMRAASGTDDIENEFEELLAVVKNELPAASNNIRKYIIMDHYEKAPKIDWYNERFDFEDAIQRNLISNDEGNGVNWSGRKLSKLRKALITIDTFLDSHEGVALANTQDDDIPMESDDREFWEYHLDL